MNLYLEVNSSDLIDDAKKLSLELNLQLIESQEKNNAVSYTHLRAHETR